MARASVETAVTSSSSSDPGLDSFWLRYLTGASVRFVNLCAAGLAVCVALYFIAPYSRFAETTTHFVPWYAAFGAIGVVIALILRRWKLASLCAVFTLFYLGLVASWYLPRPMQPAGSQPNLSIVTANLLSMNERPELFVQLVQDIDPDLVFVQELSPRWKRALEPIKATHSSYVERPQSDLFGIALYSKLPLENVDVLEFGGAQFPAIRADIYVNDRLVTLLNMHTVPPLSKDYFELRNNQLAMAADFARRQDDLVIIAGDLNITMWSPYYREFESGAGLRNTRRGFGILPNWPSNLPFFKIPLDHILVSPDILTVDIRRGPDLNSDHLPIIADMWVSTTGRRGY